ncbi:MAG: hypothetical protein ACRD08_09065, partial [Acidimicrobiales bacterium]
MTRSLAALTILAALACSGGNEQTARTRINRDTLTQRQKDSLLAASSIPGSKAVGAAMKAADSTSARIRAQNAADSAVP